MADCRISEESLTTKLLEAPQAGKTISGTGVSKYNSINDTGFEYYITRKLEDALKSSYGYAPEDIEGYKFSKSSKMATSMAKNSDMKTFVKNNIKDLIIGNGMPRSMQFTSKSDKDLYYSVSNAYILDSKLSGKNLTLKVFDIYDFDQKYITKLNSSSGGSTVLNAAGAAAMKDGKLKPYYHITEVEIDLTKLYSASQLKSLGIS